MEKIDNVLLIGSSGQIGSNIKNNLKKISKKTYCPLRKDFNLENLKSIDKFLNKIKPKLVINAAAYTKVDDAEKNKKICYKINALAPKKIAQWCYKNNAFLVYYSTDYIFSGKNNNNSWKENDKPKPINFYGKSKLEGEKFITFSKCNYLILRVSWLYADKGENFPKKIIKKTKMEIANNSTKSQEIVKNNITMNFSVICNIGYNVAKLILKIFDICKNPHFVHTYRLFENKLADQSAALVLS